MPLNQRLHVPNFLKMALTFVISALVNFIPLKSHHNFINQVTPKLTSQLRRGTFMCRILNRKIENYSFRVFT